MVMYWSGVLQHMEYITQKILVYKVDMAAKELVKINSLPHHLLFLGHNQSLCLCAEEHSLTIEGKSCLLNR